MADENLASGDEAGVAKLAARREAERLEIVAEADAWTRHGNWTPERRAAYIADWLVVVELKREELARRAAGRAPRPAVSHGSATFYFMQGKSSLVLTPEQIDELEAEGAFDERGETDWCVDFIDFEGRPVFRADYGTFELREPGGPWVKIVPTWWLGQHLGLLEEEWRQRFAHFGELDPPRLAAWERRWAIRHMEWDGCPTVTRCVDAFVLREPGGAWTEADYDVVRNAGVVISEAEWRARFKRFEPFAPPQFDPPMAFVSRTAGPAFVRGGEAWELHEPGGKWLKVDCDEVLQRGLELKEEEWRGRFEPRFGVLNPPGLELVFEDRQQ